MSKKAIELSLNVIITTIISIIILSMGIVLINKFFSVADDKLLVLDSQLENEISQMLDTGSKVAVPFVQKHIASGKSDKFAVGILNVLGGQPKKFKINIQFSEAYDGDQQICTSSTAASCGNPDTWLFSVKDQAGPLELEYEIPQYEREKFLVGVKVKNAKPAQYLFDVMVDYYNNGWKFYEGPIKITVDTG